MKRVLLWENKKRPGMYAPFSSEVANWDDGDVDAPIAMGFNNDNYAEAAAHYHRIDKLLSDNLGDKWPFTRGLFKYYHLTPVELTDEEFETWRRNEETGTDSRWEVE
ncbi:hypothetical protein ESZ50_04850 [Weissella muntiaci]|uniref:Uncharacterized protein n=1 Tax=Weissella muntiaci TaxID=2508881 RepID=A0A6C2C7A7_9LACO|nr:hypothetical protein [Weissella muntiaci]TYC49921.1 hypothetical protein ESZ50_04850 [Weissella muntiaci]